MALGTYQVDAQTLVGTGSGFLVSDAGWVMTNAHVVEGCDLVTEQTFGDATTILRDETTDLALVLFPSARGGMPLALRKSPGRLTEPVVVLGYPLTDLLGTDIRATTGSVSSLSGLHGDDRYLQISAPVQPGNSGGPVLDREGAVLGLATAVLAEEAYSASQNVNFAVTAREAARFLADNGIAFTRADETAESSSATDVVAQATTSTYLLQCRASEHGQDPETDVSSLEPYPAPRGLPDHRASMISYDDMDVLGFDYETLRDVQLNQCQSACESDRSCRAYTYNTRYEVCFLKDDAVVLVENDNAVGGFDVDLSDDVLDSGLVVTADVDSPGGDYRRIRNSDYLECVLECGIDRQCEGFAFVRSSGDCWLKDRIGRIESMSGVEFGYRR